MDLQSRVKKMVKSVKGAILDEASDLLDSKVESLKSELNEEFGDRFREIENRSLSKEDVRRIARNVLSNKRGDISEEVNRKMTSRFSDLRDSLSDDLKSNIGQLKSELPEMVEETMDGVFAELADDIAAATDQHNQNSNGIGDTQLGDASNLSDIERKILYVVQKRYENGNRKTTYRQIESVLGGTHAPIISDTMQKLEQEGWIDRDVSNRGTIFTFHKRLPREEAKRIEREI